MIRLFTVFLMLFALPLCAAASQFTKLEESLLHGDIRTARQEVERLYRDKATITTSAVRQLKAYEYVTKALEAARRAQDASQAFVSNAFEREAFTEVDLAYNRFQSTWSALTRERLPVSKPIIELINTTKNETSSAYVAAKTALASREEERKRAVEQKQERQHREAAKKEQERRAAIEAEKNRKEEEVATAKQEKTDRLDALNESAKAAGYKAIHRKFGVARFLYYAMTKGSLEEGLGHVFWVGISERDKMLDQKFKLSQAVDGWDIYDLYDVGPNGAIRLSIAIPTTGMVIEGSILRPGFYAFKGPRKFVTVMGAEKIVQTFEKVNLD